MRLLCITDLHGNAAILHHILADAGGADIILLGGDITNFGPPEEAERLLRQLQAVGLPLLAVGGNCDSPQIDRRLEQLGVLLHGRGVIHQGVGIQGLSAIPPWRPRMYQFSEEELAQALESGYAQLAGAEQHVILAHAPPHGSKLDRTYFFQHVGSRALRQFIERTQPALVICGHVHEARGIDPLGRTTVVNCGPAASGYYALAEVGAEVKVELRRA
jgi:hypothetical protein